MNTPPPSSGADSPTAEVFLRTVLKSRLLDRAGLQEALRKVPREQRDDAHALAEYLVRAGHLSRFQARKLLRGASQGLILGPYQVLAPVGKGGMSTVYMARDGRDGRLVALKVLPPSRARAQERLLARFQREMALCRCVDHPHLAYTYEAGLYKGVHYIALEYIPGKTLSRLVHDEGPLPVARAARLTAEVAAGLEHAHERGLIHRDIKPSNILVTPHDHAKVLDLGLALMEGETGTDLTVMGGHGYIVGTMDYIAPEQTHDPLAVDGRADVYSLGCTLYFALTGRPPFPGGTSRDKIHHHRDDEPTPLAELRPGLPPAFIEVVRRMMAKDPARRYPSAAAVEEELLAWAAGEPVLPLDRPEDAEYTRAVDTLRATDTSTEFSLPELPVSDASAEGDENADLNGVVAPKRTWPAWLVLVLALALALLLGSLVIGLLALLTMG
ncbi:MAG TPA: serine/threonine-protein kinase [Gemmataceae bacterium]|jgi:serine/threonine protein kinase|nr:serine/threonine-protein kinase [Gemmataceae bacterium]